MLDSKLFKDAIADAKAVRSTALANAKVALEEAFSERYHAMFAEKLKEDAATGDMTAQPAVAGAPVTEESQEIDELIKELEADLGGEEQEEAPEAPDADDAGAPPMGGAPEVPGADVPPPAPDMGAGAPPMGGDMGAGAPEGLPPAPTGFMYVLLPTPGAGAGAPPMGGDMGAGAPPMDVPPPAPDMGAGAPPAADAGATPPPSDAPPTGEDDEEEVNLDELLQSLKEEIEEEVKEEKEEVDEAKLASSAIGGKVGGSDNKKPSTVASKSSGIESGGASKDGYPSGDAKTTATDATEAKRPNQGAHVTKTNLTTPSKGGEAGPALKAARPNCKGDFENTAKINEATEDKKNLGQAIETITYLKGQLNEINLLNAKLLYTNKLFKEYGMTNEQKMRIVEMFDLSKNVREVKLTYANIAESLNFGGTDKRKVATAASSANVQSITEGLASKPVGSTKPSTKIISESKNAMVSKFQKLAGITKR